MTPAEGRTDASVHDHVRIADDRHPPGVYRVVGVGDGTVTLLRVGDSDGRRVHTGELLTVDVDAFDSFEPAENPAENRGLTPGLASLPTVAYWSVRAFGRQLMDQPVPAAAAGTVLVVGFVGDAFLPLPDLVFGALILVGSLGLAYVGSGTSS